MRSRDLHNGNVYREPMEYQMKTVATDVLEIKVLDLACGTGVMTMLLHDLGFA